MSLVAVAYHHGVFHLAPYLAVGSQGGGAIHLGPDAHLGIVAGGKGAAHACPLHHLDVFTYIYRAAFGVEARALDAGTFFDKYLARIAYHCARWRQGVRLPAGGDALIVAAQYLAVELENVPQVLDCRGGLDWRQGGGIVVVVEVLRAAVEGNELPLAVDDGLSAFQGQRLPGQLRGGDDVAGNQQVLAAQRGGELLLQVGGREIAIGAFSQQGLPLLLDGCDAYSYFGYGSRVGNGKQLLPHIVVVKDDNVFHSYGYIKMVAQSNVFFFISPNSLFFIVNCPVWH